MLRRIERGQKNTGEFLRAGVKTDGERVQFKDRTAFTHSASESLIGQTNKPIDVCLFYHLSDAETKH